MTKQYYLNMLFYSHSTSTFHKSSNGCLFKDVEGLFLLRSIFHPSSYKKILRQRLRRDLQHL